MSASASSSTTSPSVAALAQVPRQPPIFEFMKRKRWADLLVTELSEAILLVLSPACRVLFCGRAVQELLGWKDEELVDGELVELMNANDRESFRTMFAAALAQRAPLRTYARLRCKLEYFGGAEYGAAPAPKEVLFELAGYAHGVPAQCVFAVAKPYPSRNTAMLNTFLELKMENARLRQRVQELKGLSAFGASGGGGSAGGEPLSASGDSYYSLAYATASGSYASVADAEDVDDTRVGKKRKLYAVEQHVCNTCGRTDSPEWRKGPKGPKTLCNACGLRWAKKVRKFEEANEAAGGVDPGNVLDSTVPP